MNTTELKKFAQSARWQLIEQVGARLDYVLQDDSAAIRDQVKALKQLQDQITSLTAAYQVSLQCWRKADVRPNILLLMIGMQH